MERDFVGYGQRVPQVRWPEDARIAVSVVVNYEEGAEYSLLDGDSHHETITRCPLPSRRASGTSSTSRFSSTAAASGSGGCWTCSTSTRCPPLSTAALWPWNTIRRWPARLSPGSRSLWPRLQVARVPPNGPGRGTPVHPAGSGVPETYHRPSARRLVHPLRPQRQHPGTGGRR